MDSRRGLAVWLLLVPLAAGAGGWQLDRSAEQTPSAAELYLAHARLLARTEGPLAALAYLHSHNLREGALPGLLYAEYGLVDEARAALANAAEGPETDRARLALARAYLAQGDTASAERILLSLPVLLPPALDLRRASLLSRTLMYQDRHDDAALALASQSRRQELTPADRYNLGAARLRAGVGDRGAAELEELGAYTGDDPVHQALADQANVALGYWLLGRAHHGQARNVFLRVRLESPLARKAMLGLGWAEITSDRPAQPLLARTAEDCPSADPDVWQQARPLHRIPRDLCRTRRFDEQPRLAQIEGLQDTQASQYTRAAVAWQAAAEDGDPGDPVVAEALAALPYALAEAGDKAAASEAFQTAIGRLNATREKLRTSAEPAPDTPLAHLADELRATRHYLNERASALEAADPALAERLEALARRSERLLGQVQTAAAAAQNRHVRQLQTQIETYLIHSRLGLAALQP